MITNDMKRKDKEFYELHIAGLTRQLQKFSVSDNLDIAAFILFCDVELAERCAAELLKKVPEFDYIVTAESKGIPLAYEMARQSGKDYIVARKNEKLYMKNVITTEVNSITTDFVQKLCLGEEDAEYMNGKKILVVDDVISTGESLKSLEVLIAQTKGNIVAKMAVLAEGDAADRDDIIFLEKLPLFNADGTVK